MLSRSIGANNESFWNRINLSLKRLLQSEAQGDFFSPCAFFAVRSDLPMGSFFATAMDAYLNRAASTAALKSWVFPSPVTTPVMMSRNKDTHWAPFKLSYESLNSYLGGNDQIDRPHAAVDRIPIRVNGW